MKKKEVLYVLFLIEFILISSFVSGSFIKGNVSSDIETSYSPGETLRGWINISLQNEPANSMLTAFDSSHNLLDFLENTGAISECFPYSENCDKPHYSTSAQSTSKTFNLAVAKSKVIGLKISENTEIESISSFSMKVASSAGELGYPQLIINILNDSEIEWQSYTASGNFGSEIYGCYTTATDNAEITQTPYCQKISVPISPSVKIGADILEVPGKGGNVDFEMNLYDEDYSYQASCTASATSSGKIFCILSNYNVAEEQDFFVCINTKNSLDNNKYSIGYEQTDSCGFTGNNYDSFSHDFNIFIKTGKFAPVGTFILNNQELENYGINAVNIQEYLTDYIDTRYDNDCSDSCVMPIRFFALTSQNITLSDVSLSYVSGISKTTNNLYEVQEQEAKINMDFQKLDLKYSNLSVPTSYGDKTLYLRLNNVTIVEQDIEVARGPLIDRVIPTQAPAAVSVRFIVFVSGANITNYKWDFGDNTALQETNINQTYHTYGSLGTYTLKVIAQSAIGESSKSFSIKVVSPKEMINYTLKEKRADLNNATAQLNAMSVWFKSELEKAARLSDIDAELKNLERKYEIASTSSEYVEIMSNLSALNIPSSIGISESSSGPYIPNVEEVDPSYLLEIGAGSADNPEDYKESVVSWFNEYISMDIERGVYSLYYSDRTDELLTSFKVKIKAKKDFLKELYLIIDRDYEEITFKSSDYRVKSAGDAVGIMFSSLSGGEEKIVEFIVPEKTGIITLPVYVSPEFSELPEAVTPGICNFNGECEKNKGETWRNCRKDCKPWGWVVFYIILLLFIAFVIYILLQEWYKRYYEERLFKNRNDLFNLVNFIHNAINQGLSKEEIIKRLKKHGWNKEQITYAYKKVKGQRTGMWEIPIFRYFEKRKMNEEIEKRQRQQSFQQGFQFQKRI